LRGGVAGVVLCNESISNHCESRPSSVRKGRKGRDVVLPR
jgi:hypothetical protein